MATNYPALQLSPIEVSRRQCDGEVQKIIELATLQNEILQDIPVEEANAGTQNNTVVRESRPGGTKRSYNQGVASSSSQTAPIEDYVAEIKAHCDVDCSLADQSPNKQALLDTESVAHIEGMSDTLAEMILYGNRSTDPADINGLHIRYSKLVANSVVQPATPNASAGHSCSVWLIKTGLDKVSYLYPRGGSANLGVKRDYKGRVDVRQTDGDIEVYRTWFTLQAGIAIKNPNAVKRICNIKTDGTESGEEILNAIIRVRPYLAKGSGRVVIWAPPNVKAALDVYAMSKSNACYTVDGPFGEPVTMFQGIPVRQIDSGLITEAILT